MRRLLALGAALAALLVVLVAPPASAGGPTSVLAVNYDRSRAAGALTGSAAYADLEKALDVYNPPTGDERGPASFMDTRLRLTWLIHDVTPWRVDAISIVGGDVWVETAVSPADGTSLFESPTVRHRAHDTGLLLRTLTRLGVYDGTTAGANQSAGAAVSGPVGNPIGNPIGNPDGNPDGNPAATPNSLSAPAASGLTWWAGAAGALLTLGLGTILGAVLARRTRPSTTAPERGEQAEPAEPAGTRPGTRHPDLVPTVGFTPDADPCERSRPAP